MDVALLNRLTLASWLLLSLNLSLSAEAKNSFCKDSIWAINSALHQVQKCHQHSDCIATHFDAPFTCGAAINQNHPQLPTTKQQITKHLSRCKPPKKPTTCSKTTPYSECIAGICTFADPTMPRFPQQPGQLHAVLQFAQHTIKKHKHIWTLTPKHDADYDYLTIRFEAHSDPHLSHSDAQYYPRHHGYHYHVVKHLASSKKKRKVKPMGYIIGAGTGFLPGESMPSILAPYLK